MSASVRNAANLATRDAHAATRRRIANEGADELPGEPNIAARWCCVFRPFVAGNGVVRRALSVREPALRQLAEPRCRRGWISASRPQPSAPVAGNDAPLIGERAATRGRGASECGERAVVRQTSSFGFQPRKLDRTPCPEALAATRPNEMCLSVGQLT